MRPRRDFDLWSFPLIVVRRTYPPPSPIFSHFDFPCCVPLSSLDFETSLSCPQSTPPKS